MGDIGEYWKDYKGYVLPHIKNTRNNRVNKFASNFKDFKDLLELWNIDIKINNHNHHIQFRVDEFIANYYPSTKKFFFQKPRLLPTIIVPPENAIQIFLQQARSVGEISNMFKSSYWSFEDKQKSKNMIKLGSFVMPQVRGDFLKLAAEKPDLIKNVDSYEFENLVAELLSSKGYEVKVTPSRKDGGKDIIAITNKNNEEYIMLVECKKWLANNVGIDIIQRIVGVRYIEKANHSMIVTTAKFTKDAKGEAAKVVDELTLVDFNLLTSWLKEYDKIM